MERTSHNVENYFQLGLILSKLAGGNSALRHFIVSLILSSKCFYNAMRYIQSFLYDTDNHLLLRNCISLLISVCKLLFYLYPDKYTTILLNIYQQVMCKIAGVERNMNNKIVCFVTHKIAVMPNLLIYTRNVIRKVSY